MKKIKRILKEQKGSYSLLAVILVLILVLVFTSYMDIMNKKWSLSEVQTMMDSAGINTLQNQVNNKALRAEILSFDEENTANDDYADTNEKMKHTVAEHLQKYRSDMILYYKAELARQMKDRTNVTDYEVKSIDIQFTYDNWGLGNTTKELPQISIESVVTMRVSQTGVFDKFDQIQKTMYSARNNENFTVTYNGRTKDGQAELIVRSLTRLVYR